MDLERLFELINLKTFVAVYYDLVDHVQNSADMDAADAAKILDKVMDESAKTIYGVSTAYDVALLYEDGSLGE